MNDRDDTLKEQLRRYQLLFRVGQTITSEIDMDVLFEVIMGQTNQILGTERSTVFLHDSKSDTLYSLVATGMKLDEIRIASNHGVAGWVFQHQQPAVINDAYHDPRFSKETDKQSGFQTRNILCIPLINRKSQCIGVLQTLNKIGKNFDDADVEMLASISHYMAIALENAKLYEELKLLDKARMRVIHHLSHELKTPLTIILGVLDRLEKKSKELDDSSLSKTVSRGQRNVQRLLSLQNTIDDILNDKPVSEKERILDIIDSALDLIEELGEQTRYEKSAILKSLSNKLEDICACVPIWVEPIEIDGLLQTVCDDAENAMSSRELEITRNFHSDSTIRMDRNVVYNVCIALLKNAIENTPDQGKIEISSEICNNEVLVNFRDYGVGITSENQKMIFGGFFHTQDTNLYTSKSPYQFDAGGTGSDLLRIRVLSERFGFSIQFDSKRCEYIPLDTDQCPGRIAECRSIAEKSECFLSGSIFSVRFPILSGDSCF